MKTIAYIRISTDKQDEASQRQIIAEHCAATGKEITAYATDQVSGSIPWQERALSFALADCSAGDQIITSEISRIARSTVGVLTFLQAAAEKSVSVVAIRSGINLDGSTSSKIVVTVLAMAAEIERDLLRERTRASLQARKASGLPIGRQPGAKNKRSKLDGKAGEIDSLMQKGVSKSAISRILSVSRVTLDTFLNNQKGVDHVANN